MNFYLKEQFGKYCLTKEQGEELYKAIEQPLLNKENITIDMCDTIVSATFLNNSIGKLLSILDKDEINNLLKIIDDNKYRKGMIDTVIDNAEKFYKNIYRNTKENLTNEIKEVLEYNDLYKEELFYFDKDKIILNDLENKKNFIKSNYLLKDKLKYF